MAGRKVDEIVEELKQRILDGVYTKKLPSDRALIAHYGISKTTVRAVMSELEARHLIERRRGSGTYLVPQARDRASGIFGVIMPEARTPFYAAMSEGIVRAVKGAGGGEFSVLTADLGRKAPAIATAAERLADLCVLEHATGVFLRPLPAGRGNAAAQDRILARFRAARIPVVIVDGDAAKLPEGTGCDLVGAKGYSTASLEIAALLGDIAFRLLQQRLHYGAHPPAEVILDPPFNGAPRR